MKANINFKENNVKTFRKELENVMNDGSIGNLAIGSTMNKNTRFEIQSNYTEDKE